MSNAHKHMNSIGPAKVIYGLLISNCIWKLYVHESNTKMHTKCTYDGRDIKPLWHLTVGLPLAMYVHKLEACPPLMQPTSTKPASSAGFKPAAIPRPYASAGITVVHTHTQWQQAVVVTVVAASIVQ
jgi:hypothetical protein